MLFITQVISEEGVSFKVSFYLTLSLSVSSSPSLCCDSVVTLSVLGEALSVFDWLLNDLMALDCLVMR